MPTEKVNTGYKELDQAFDRLDKAREYCEKGLPIEVRAEKLERLREKQQCLNILDDWLNKASRLEREPAEKECLKIINYIKET